MAVRLLLPLSLEEAKRKLFKINGGSFEFPVQDADTAREAVECLKHAYGFTYSAVAIANGESASNFCTWRRGKGPRVRERVGEVVIEWLNEGVHDGNDDSIGDLGDGIKKEPTDDVGASSDWETTDEEGGSGVMVSTKASSHKTKPPEKVQLRVQSEDDARRFVMKLKNDHKVNYDDMAKAIGVTSKDLSRWVSCGHVGKKVIDWVNGGGGGGGGGSGGHGGGRKRTEQLRRKREFAVEKVYIMTDNYKRFKVGHSIDPDRRLRELRTGNVSLKLLDRFPVSSAKAEKVAHKALEQYRWTRSGEWFYGPYEEIKAVVIEAIRDFIPPK